MTIRIDGRNPYQLRPVSFQPHFLKHPIGSVLISSGDTRVVCTTSMEDRVPPFLKGTGTGWLTAEYAMLPGATSTRTPRDSGRTGGVSGRSHEIQRLIGRALRTVINLQALGERTLTVDCDVLQADGGTRTAAVNGACISLVYAVDCLLQQGILRKDPIVDLVTAISVGIVDGEALLDLCYAEDSRADVDMNVIQTGAGGFVEIQGTAEKSPFSDTQLSEMLEVARMGLDEIREIQVKMLGGPLSLLQRFPSWNWLKIIGDEDGDDGL